MTAIQFNDVNFRVDADIQEIKDQHDTPVLASDKYSHVHKSAGLDRMIVHTVPDLTAGEITTIISWSDAKGYSPTDVS